MLREDQIVRYSRQILLKSVGGLGQERLLSLQVEWNAEGSASSTAIAYLAAGGASVQVPSGQEVTRAQLGFLAGEHERGMPVLARLEALNPDAVRQAPDPLRIELIEKTEAAGPESGRRIEERPSIARSLNDAAPPHAQVLIAGEGAAAVVVVSDPRGCAHCFHAHSSVESPVPPTLSVAAGTFAALAIQRIALRLSEPLGSWRLFDDGRIERRPLSGCAHLA